VRNVGGALEQPEHLSRTSVEQRGKAATKPHKSFSLAPWGRVGHVALRHRRRMKIFLRPRGGEGGPRSGTDEGVATRFSEQSFPRRATGEAVGVSPKYARLSWGDSPIIRNFRRALGQARGLIGCGRGIILDSWRSRLRASPAAATPGRFYAYRLLRKSLAQRDFHSLE
jgi:hypothetical protein